MPIPGEVGHLRFASISDLLRPDKVIIRTARRSLDRLEYHSAVTAPMIGLFAEMLASTMGGSNEDKIRSYVVFTGRYRNRFCRDAGAACSRCQAESLERRRDRASQWCNSIGQLPQGSQGSDCQCAWPCLAHR